MKCRASAWIAHTGAINVSFADLSLRKVKLPELWNLNWHRQVGAAKQNARPIRGCQGQRVVAVNRETEAVARNRNHGIRARSGWQEKRKVNFLESASVEV